MIGPALVSLFAAAVALKHNDFISELCMLAVLSSTYERAATCAHVPFVLLPCYAFLRLHATRRLISDATSKHQLI